MNLETKLVKAVLQFAEELIEDDREKATFAEAVKLAEEIGYSVPTPVIRELKKYGISVIPQEVPREVRGFKSNNHNLWSSPSMKSHGGSGGAALQGFATENRPFNLDAAAGDSAKGSRDKETRKTVPKRIPTRGRGNHKQVPWCATARHQGLQ